MINEKSFCRYCKHKQYKPYSDRAQCSLGLTMDNDCEKYEPMNNDYASKDEGYDDFLENVE